MKQRVPLFSASGARSSTCCCGGGRCGSGQSWKQLTALSGTAPRFPVPAACHGTRAACRQFDGCSPRSEFPAETATGSVRRRHGTVSQGPFEACPRTSEIDLPATARCDLPRRYAAPGADQPEQATVFGSQEGCLGSKAAGSHVASSLDLAKKR